MLEFLSIFQFKQAFIWWQVVVAVIGALILLLFFILALVYCNCFKRKPRKEQEDNEVADFLQQGQITQGEDDTFLTAKSIITD